jgi:uncharacterized delta-60 repeat protein
MKYKPNSRHEILPAWARRALVCAAVVFCVGSLTYRASAGGGTLDWTFNVSGTATEDVGGDDEAYAAALQPDGKIVVAGSTTPAGDPYHVRLALARFNPDGTADTTFGTGGKVVGAAESSGAHAVAVQTDGKILTAGFGPSDVRRFNPDGSVDTTFGTGGATGRLLNPYALLLQPDGKILVGGYLNVVYHNSDFAVVRYNPDGSPDTTFGTGGRATTEFFGSKDEIHALALQPDGRVVAVGQSVWGSSNYYAALARYNADGSPDTGFGNSGKVITDFSPNDGMKYHRLYAVAVQPDGRILAAGAARHYDDWDSFAAARYNYDGSPDLAFGNGGQVVTKILGLTATGNAVALQPDGKFFVAGCASGSSGCYATGSYALAHFNSNGTPDTDFGYNHTGQLTTQVSGFGDTAAAALLQPDGKLIVAGSSSNSSNLDFSVARYLTGSTRQPPAPPPAPPPAATKGDNDPAPPPSDGDIGPGENPPGTR